MIALVSHLSSGFQHNYTLLSHKYIVHKTNIDKREKAPAPAAFKLFMGFAIALYNHPPSIETVLSCFSALCCLIWARRSSRCFFFFFFFFLIKTRASYEVTILYGLNIHIDRQILDDWTISFPMICLREELTPGLTPVSVVDREVNNYVDCRLHSSFNIANGRVELELSVTWTQKANT